MEKRHLNSLDLDQRIRNIQIQHVNSTDHYNLMKKIEALLQDNKVYMDLKITNKGSRYYLSLYGDAHHDISIYDNESYFTVLIDYAIESYDERCEYRRNYERYMDIFNDNGFTMKTISRYVGADRGR